MRAMGRRQGFTLVELMIVVALIGVLAAVAIPSFLSYQARSRRAEAYTNLGSVARSQKSFFATKGVFHGSGLPYPDDTPYGGLGTHKMTWDAASENAFGDLGWAPEGDVFYSYHNNAGVDQNGIAGSNCSCELCFTSTAYGDVDGDGDPSAVMYVEPLRESDGDIAGVCRSGMPMEFDFGPPTRLGESSPLYNEVAVQRSLDEY